MKQVTLLLAFVFATMIGTPSFATDLGIANIKVESSTLVAQNSVEIPAPAAVVQGEADAEANVTNEDFIADLLGSLGGLAGATTLAIVGIVITLGRKFLLTPWAAKTFENDHMWREAITLVLAWAGGVVGLMQTASMTFGAAFLHSTTLGAFLLAGAAVYRAINHKA